MAEIERHVSKLVKKEEEFVEWNQEQLTENLHESLRIRYENQLKKHMLLLDKYRRWLSAVVAAKEKT